MNGRRTDSPRVYRVVIMVSAEERDTLVAWSAREGTALGTLLRGIALSVARGISVLTPKNGGGK